MDYKETYEKILEEYRQVFERVDQQNMREFIDEVKAHDRIFLIDKSVCHETDAYGKRDPLDLGRHNPVDRRRRSSDRNPWGWTYRTYQLYL